MLNLALSLHNGFFSCPCYIENFPFEDLCVDNASVFADVFGVFVGIEQEQDVNHKVVDANEKPFVFTSC